MKPQAPRTKFYTIHRDASEVLAPISRGKWVNSIDRPSIEIEKDKHDIKDQNIKQEDVKLKNMSDVDVGMSSVSPKNEFSAENNATSASRSRWFRGY